MSNLGSTFRMIEKSREELLERAGLFCDSNTNKYTCTECKEVINFFVDESSKGIGTYFISITPKEILPTFVAANVHPECERVATERYNLEQAEKDRSDLKAGREGAFEKFMASIDFPEPEKAELKHVPGLELFKSWKLGDEFGFLLYGPSGTGKTYASVALAKRIAREVLLTKTLADFGGRGTQPDFDIGGLPYFIKLSSLFQEAMQNKFEAPGKYVRAQFLFLDDLGTENITDFKREVFYNLIDHRSTAKRPTFITTNLSLAQLKERFFERVTSRILGMCVPIEVKGDDRRLSAVELRIAELKRRVSKGVE